MQSLMKGCRAHFSDEISYVLTDKKWKIDLEHPFYHVGSGKATIRWVIDKRARSEEWVVGRIAVSRCVYRR